MSQVYISIVVPAFNEEGNLTPLVKRIDANLRSAGIGYEVLVVNDRSTDGTREETLTLSKDYPVRLVEKQGPQGKAFSLLEGFAQAKYDVVGMMDADLQYPPEALAEMVERIASGEADVVVANRNYQGTGWKRRVVSKAFRWVFGKGLHGLNCDVQSGLKVWRKQVLEGMELDPTGWTFDLEFLLNAREAGYRIGGVEIDFAERTVGQAKVNILKTSLEIGWSALKLKMRRRKGTMTEQKSEEEEKWVHKGQRYEPRTDLPKTESAFEQATGRQKLVIGLLTALLVLGLAVNWRGTLIGVISGLTLYYLADLVFSLWLVYRSLAKDVEFKVTEEEMNDFGDKWPSYTILCPLYKEWQVVPQFVQGIQQLDYPKDRLQVLLLLEEDDRQTINKVGEFDLPDYFQVVVVPHGLPKTKPKACNYGLSMAKGEYVVVYDAEDWPDALQLKKAVLAFRKAGPQTICIQAKLNYYNQEQNLLTRLFTAEYSLWFDLILPGLQSIQAPIPLGGTSNHFRTEDLLRLHKWDAFNVTEDCDLGMRLVKHGYQTAIVDSTTWEEANSRIFNWYRQRTRWVKGYVQTYLVHMRRNKQSVSSNQGSGIQELGVRIQNSDVVKSDDDGWTWVKNLYFQLTVGGKVLSMMVNPFLWLLTASYFAFRPIVGEVIESLYLTPILYLGVFSMVFGNFCYLYAYMVGCAKRGQWELIKYVFLVPFYWLGMSVAAWRAGYEVIVNPYYWAKTKHGFHLEQAEEEVVEEPAWGPEVLPQPAPVYATASAVRGGRMEVPINAEMGSLPGLANGKRRGLISLGDFWPLSWLNGKTDQAESQSGQTDGKAGARKTRRVDKEQTGWLIDQLKSATSMGGVLVGASVASNFLNFLYNAYLGRAVSVEQFGLVSLMGSLVYLAQIPLQAVSRTVMYKSGYWLGEHGEVAKRFWRYTRWQAMKVAIAITGMWLMTVPIWARVFQSSDMLPFYLFTPVWIIGTLYAIDSGFLRGSMKFAAMGVVILTEALAKLVISVVLVKLGLNAWVYAAIPVSMGMGLFIGWSVAIRLPVDMVEASKKQIRQLSYKFVGTSLMTKLATLGFMNLDVVAAKYFLSPVEAGEYALLSLVGKMVFFGGSLFAQFIPPLVSREEGAGRDSKSVFYKLLGLATVVNLAGFVAVGWLGRLTVPLLLGEKSRVILGLLPIYAGASVLFAIANNFMSYYQLKKKNVFPVVGLGLSIMQVAGLAVWHQSVEMMAMMMLLSGVVFMEGMLVMHVFAKQIEKVMEKVFGRVRIVWGNGSGNGHKELEEEEGKGLRILIYNWRDIKHVWAGGAEVYAHEMAKRWVKEGHEVTLFCGNDKKNKEEEVIDGVRIVRKGGFYTVYFWAFWCYVTRFRGKFDVVVDCENGIPFFTPLYVRKPKFLVVYHVHQGVYLKHLQLRWYLKSFAVIAKLMEGVVMPWLYRNEQVVTISESSKKDIVSLGRFKPEQIEFAYCGVNLKDYYRGAKTKYPSFVYVGRHQAYKNVDVGIKAFSQVVKKFPDARLEIAGEGEKTRDLMKLVKNLRVEKSVKFWGKVSEKVKVKLLSSSWVLLQPSSIEGWSLVVLEANACGTPTIAAKVHGLCDSVVDGKTGWLVALKDVDAWAKTMEVAITHESLRSRMGSNAYVFVQQFTWDKAAEKFLQLIEDAAEVRAVPEEIKRPRLVPNVIYQRE